MSIVKFVVGSIEVNYKKAAINAILHEVTAYFVKYGYNETIAQRAIDKINFILGENRFTTNDIRDLLSRIGDTISRKYTGDGYYGTEVPRVARLIWRDKVFYARSGAISEWLEERL